MFIYDIYGVYEINLVANAQLHKFYGRSLILKKLPTNTMNILNSHEMFKRFDTTLLRI